MKRDLFKGAIMGSALTAAVLTFMTAPTAANSRQTLDVAYRDIAVYVDGVKITPRDASGNIVEPFIYNGTTFLPVRAVASAFGFPVEWDGARSSVYIGKRPGSASAYSMSSPAPVGISQSIPLSGAGVKGSAEISLEKVLRGEDAMNTLRDANRIPASPKDGFEYVLARFKVSITELPDVKSINVNSSMFDVFSSQNIRYSASAPVIAPSPQLSGQLNLGASVEGWVVFQVSQDDPAPKCVFCAESGGSGGAWFSLKHN